LKGLLGLLTLPLYLGAVALAAWAVHGFHPFPEPRLQAPSGMAATAIVMLSALALLAIPSIWARTATPQRRIGARQVVAGIPDLALAAVYVAVLMLPGLAPEKWVRILAYGIAVEGIATYTMVWILFPADDPDPIRRMIPRIVVPLIALIGVGALSANAGSFWLFAGFAVFIANKILPDRLAPPADDAAAKKRHLHRCMASTAIFVLFGIPAVVLAIVKPVNLSAGEWQFLALAFGAYYFAWMAIQETFGTAPPAKTMENAA